MRALVVKTLVAGIICLALLGCSSLSNVPELEAGLRGSGSEEVVQTSTDINSAPRIALVIGNDTYSLWPALTLGATDAGAIAQKLKSRNFKLVGGGAQINVGEKQFAALLSDLKAAITSEPGAVVVIYYSGHGFSKNGVNYIAGIDSPLPAQAAQPLRANSLAETAVYSGAAAVYMFLDACRFETNLSRGLTDEQAPERTFIGYATFFGTTASEGFGRQHSFYTAALLENADKPWGLVGDMHVRVSADVRQKTSDRQVPVSRKGRNAPVVNIFAPLGTLASAVGPKSGYSEAKRCAQFANSNLIAYHMPDSVWHYEVGSVRFTADRPVPSLQDVLQNCKTAWDNGHRDSATIRGYAFMILFPAGRDYYLQTEAGGTEKPVKTSFSVNAPPQTVGHPQITFEQAQSMLAQAAEDGDGEALQLIAQEDLKAGRNEIARQKMLRAALAGSSDARDVAQALLGQDTSFQRRWKFAMDRKTGLAILVKESQRGNIYALQGLIHLVNLKKISAQESGLRGILRDTLSNPSFSYGFASPGLTLRQMVYMDVAIDAHGGRYGPVEEASYVRYALAAESFFSIWERSLGVTPAGRPAYLVGCLLLDRLPFNPPRDKVLDRSAGIRFLQMASADGDAAAKDDLTRMQANLPPICDMHR